MDQSPAAAAQRLALNKRAIFSAAKSGDTETMVDLLDEGVEIDTKDDVGMSLLHWAAQYGHVTTMRLLIRRGCNVDSADGRGLTALHVAAGMGQTKAVRDLIRKGASKSVVAVEFGTPLHQAASKGHVKTVVAMLEEGCPLDVVNTAGDTVLHGAAECGHVEVVRELVSRGCNVNAENAVGHTPLHCAAVCGRTEAVRELIKLGATKLVVAGMYGTPLHLAIPAGDMETVEALLEDEFSERSDSTLQNVTTSKAHVTECNVIGSCNVFGQTPVMCALLGGQVEVFKFLTSKGGNIFGRDAHSLSAFEHCFVGGQASKLSQFCEACGIRSRGEGLKGALAALISHGFVDAHKVLCLCAVSGDSVFLDDQFIELVASDDCILPAAVKSAKHLFFEGVSFINQLSIPDENALNPLHISLLSFKCFEMGFTGSSSVQSGAKDHTSFITKLLCHPVLKRTVNEKLPNGLSPLDLAQQFELHHIAELIEKAGGRPGVWADIPQDVFLSYRRELFTMYPSLMKVCDTSQGGHEAVKKAVIRLLGGQTVESVVHVADDSRLVKERVLGLRPDLGDIVKHVLPRIKLQARHWKKFGLALGMRKSTLDEFGEHFSNDDDCHLETLSYWLEHGSSVTWKTLLNVLGHFETKHTVDELTDKIASVLGGGHQEVIVSGPFGPVMCSVPVVGGGIVAAERSPPSGEAKQVLDLFRDQFIADMDANAVVWELLHKGIISRGVQERISKADEPKQRNEILHDWLQRTCNKEALMEVCDIIVAVRGHPKMQNLGEVMKCRLHTATPVQVVQKHAEKFLREMNCKVIAPNLKTLKLIPESVECDILQSKSKKEANVRLLNHLKEEADEDTVREVFRIASEKAGYGKMNKFAAGVLRELQ